MTPENSESFNLTRMLHRWKWPRARNPQNDDRDDTNLLRYTLQLAAEGRSRQMYLPSLRSYSREMRRRGMRTISMSE
jgi:hypothetical protein